jgi:hypothetical protein
MFKSINIFLFIENACFKFHFFLSLCFNWTLWKTETNEFRISAFLSFNIQDVNHNHNYKCLFYCYLNIIFKLHNMSTLKENLLTKFPRTNKLVYILLLLLAYKFSVRNWSTILFLIDSSTKKLEFKHY